MQTKRIAKWALSLSVLLAIAVTLNASAGDLDSYAYRLETGRDTQVCRHMLGIYNDNFSEPWNLGPLPLDEPPFPMLPGVEYDKRLGGVVIAFSAFPSSPEFEAVNWREGRVIRNAAKNETTRMLVAEVDLNNDGQNEILLKTAFMLSYTPAGGSAPGGQDTIFAFRKNQVDLSIGVTGQMLYRQTGSESPVQIDDGTLGMSARIIRPFIYKGVTYLSVYEQLVPEFGSQEVTGEKMWVLKYRDGGRNLGDGHWAPVQADRICEFRMIPQPQGK